MNATIASAAMLLVCAVSLGADKDGYQDSFELARQNLASTARSDYFILDPGYQLVLEGLEKGEPTRLVINVMDKTKDVDGVRTRVVEQRKSVRDKLVEVTREFVTIDRATRDVYLFGIDVDEYKDGQITGHAASWLAGQHDARPALLMPGKPQAGGKFYRSLAPETSMTRRQIVTIDEKVQVPAGAFDRCVKCVDSQTVPPDPDSTNTRFVCYAPGIGLAVDGTLVLVKYSANVDTASIDEKGLPRPPPPLEPLVPHELARAALDFVGVDPDAEMVWVAAINDPVLTPQQRQDLIEDLNEQGFADPHNVTIEELPIVLSRLELIEQLAPDAMDEVNAAAFAEAYKDLSNIAERLMR